MTTNVLVFYDDRWHIAYMSVVSERNPTGEGRTPPFPAFYDAHSSSLICLFGEESFAVELIEPTATQMHDYEEHQRAVQINGGEALFKRGPKRASKGKI